MADEKDDISFGISMDASKAEASIKSFSVTLDDLAKLANTQAKSSLSSLDSKIGDVGSSFDKQTEKVKTAAEAFERLSKGSSEAASQLITLSRSIILPEIKLPNFSQVLKAQFGESSQLAKNAARDIQDAFNRIKISRPSVSDIREAAGGSRTRSPISTAAISSAANLGSSSLQLSRSKAFLDDKLNLQAAIRNLSENRTPLPSTLLGKGVAPVGPFPVLPQLEPTVRARVASSFTSLEAYKSTSSYRAPELPRVAGMSGAGFNLPSIVPAPRPMSFPQFLAQKTDTEDAAENDRLAAERRKRNQDRAAAETATLLAERRIQKAAEEEAVSRAKDKRAEEIGRVIEKRRAGKDLTKVESTMLGDWEKRVRSTATTPDQLALANRRIEETYKPRVRSNESYQNKWMEAVTGKLPSNFDSLTKKGKDLFTGSSGGKSKKSEFVGDWSTGASLLTGAKVASLTDMRGAVPRMKSEKISNLDFIRKLRVTDGDAEADLFKFQLSRLAGGSIAQRVKSSKIPAYERQASFLSGGSALTPREQLDANAREQKERERIERQQEAERKRVQRIQTRILRGTRGEEYTNRFSSFFAGQGYRQDPAIGPDGRTGLMAGLFSGTLGRAKGDKLSFDGMDPWRTLKASASSLVLTLSGVVGPTIGRVASEIYGMGQSISVVFSGIQIAFKALSSVVSTVTSVIATAFKAAFTGVAVVGAVAIAGLTAAFMGVKKVVDITMEGFERGKALSNLSQQTGVAVQSLVRLEKAFEAAGMKASDIAPTIAAMSRSVYVANSYKENKSSGGTHGSGVHSLTGGVRGAMMAPKMFENLGLDPTKLKKMTEVDAFLTIGKAINSLKNPIDRVSASMAIFKGNGERLLGLFANPAALDLLREKLTATNVILSQQSFLFREAAERYQKIKAPDIKTGLGQIGVGIGSEVAGEFLKLTDTMGRVDFAPIGQKIGAEIGLAMEAFRSGKMVQYLNDSFLLFKDYVSTQVDSLFAGTFFSPDTTEFYNNLLSTAADFGATILSSLDQLSAKVFGINLMTVVNGVSTVLGILANVFVTVGTMIISATARLAQWAEKAYRVITGFNKEQADRGGMQGAMYGALSGAAYMGIAGLGAGGVGAIPAALIGAIGGGIAGYGYGYARMGLANSKGAGQPTSITDSQISQLDSSMEKVREMFKKLSEATGEAVDKINDKVDEKTEEDRDKSGRTKEAELQSAELRNQRLAIDKANIDFAAFKDSLPDPTKQAMELRNKETTPRWAGVVASSLQEIGGGGGVYVPTGEDQLLTANQITATNTGLIAQRQQELLQKLGINQKGPTTTGLTVGEANANPELQQALLDLQNPDKISSKMDESFGTGGGNIPLPKIPDEPLFVPDDTKYEPYTSLIPDPEIMDQMYPKDSDVKNQQRQSMIDMLSGGYTAEMPNRYTVLTRQAEIENQRNETVSRLGSYGQSNGEQNTPDMGKGDEQQLSTLSGIRTVLEKILAATIDGNKTSGTEIIKVGL